MSRELPQTVSGDGGSRRNGNDTDVRLLACRRQLRDIYQARFSHQTPCGGLEKLAWTQVQRCEWLLHRADTRHGLILP